MHGDAGERRIPVVLFLDSEPDEPVFPIDQPAPWRGIELFAEETQRLRDIIEAATGVPAAFAWGFRCDPQIAQSYGSPAYGLERFGAFLDTAEQEGDAVGVHPHAWRWSAKRGEWIGDHSDQAWIAECVTMSVETFAAVRGEVPTFHRFGGEFMSTATMNLVRDLGVRIDSTVEPGLPTVGSGRRDGLLWKGVTGNMGRAPIHPYQPDRADYRTPDPDPADDFWTIPHAVGRPHIAPRLPITDQLRHWATKPSALRARARERLLRQQRDRVSLRMLDPRTPENFWQTALDAIRDDPWPCLAFSMRSEVFLFPALAQRFVGVLEGLRHLECRHQLQFTTPAGALALCGVS